jgi:hypothetical protein
LLSMLSDSPQPELGIVSWSRWNQIHKSGDGPTASDSPTV